MGAGPSPHQCNGTFPDWQSCLFRLLPNKNLHVNDLELDMPDGANQA
jgi:hypothetical protein